MMFAETFYKAVELQTELGDEEAHEVALQLAEYCRAKGDKKAHRKWLAIIAAMEELERGAHRPH